MTWPQSSCCLLSSRNNLLRKSLQWIIILFLASKTFQRPGNSQGMCQEWATIRTILHLPDGYITEGTQRCLLMCYSVQWLRIVWESVITVIEHDKVQRYYEDGNWIGSYPSGDLKLQSILYSYNTLPMNCEQDRMNPVRQYWTVIMQLLQNRRAVTRHHFLSMEEFQRELSVVKEYLLWGADPEGLSKSEVSVTESHLRQESMTP